MITIVKNKQILFVYNSSMAVCKAYQLFKIVSRQSIIILIGNKCNPLKLKETCTILQNGMMATNLEYDTNQ